MDRLLARLLLVLSPLPILVWLGVAVARIDHPFELEWQEGGMLAHVQRLRAGEGLYAEPTLEFMAFPYPPLFPWAAAGTTALTGEGFLPLRLVSLLATLATLVLLGAYVSRDTGQRAAGLVAAGLYGAAYRWGGAWFDVGRVDALSIALAMGALYAARFRGGLGGAALAGALGGLAFLTKQTTLGIVLPLGVPLFARDRREAAVFALTLGILAGAVVGVLHRGSDGWSSWYVFGLLGGHPWYPPKVGGFWTQDLLWLAPTFFAALGGLPREGERAGRAFLLWPTLGMLAVAWMGRAHIGGYDNTLLPAALAAALLGGRVVGRALRRRGPIAPGVFALLLVQLLLLAYDPRYQLPAPGDVAAGERVVAELAAIDGELFAPHQGYLALRAGKAPSVHAMAFGDLLSSGGHEAVARPFVERLERALVQGRYAAVLLAERWDQPASKAYLPALDQHYDLARTLLEPAEDGADEVPPLTPVTGAPVRPRYLFLRRE